MRPDALPNVHGLGAAALLRVGTPGAARLEISPTEIAQLGDGGGADGEVVVLALAQVAQLKVTGGVQLAGDVDVVLDEAEEACLVRIRVGVRLGLG